MDFAYLAERGSSRFSLMTSVNWKKKVSEFSPHALSISFNTCEYWGGVDITLYNVVEFSVHSAQM